MRQMRFHWGISPRSSGGKKTCSVGGRRAAVGAVPNNRGLVELLLLALVGPVAGGAEGAGCEDDGARPWGGGSPLEAMVLRPAAARAALAMVLVASNMVGGGLDESCRLRCGA